MSNYLYEAVDASGLKCQGVLDVIDQTEALKRIKEMGLYPTKVSERLLSRQRSRARSKKFELSMQLSPGRVKQVQLAVFTRQLATLVDVGMPLLRGLRLLQEQEENTTLKRVIGELAQTIEGGGTLSEAMALHPKVFDKLYVNMVKAGEIGGILETVLKRQAEFMEKAQKIKGKVKAAMFYPAAVVTVAVGIIGLMLAFIIPRFKTVFDGLMNGKPLPALTQAVLNISEAFKSHYLAIVGSIAVAIVLFNIFVLTKTGRQWFDRFKLVMPVVGKVSRKVALARFSRTLGTLLGSGVPILQALNIVKETSGNVVVGKMISKIHDNVKQGGTVTEPLRQSRIFPAMISGMVDVGEQTGALPDMLTRIADTADEQVDTAVTAMTSLLEPIMIIFLAVIVGGVVLAMFLPIFGIINDPGMGGPGDGN